MGETPLRDPIIGKFLKKNTKETDRKEKLQKTILIVLELSVKLQLQVGGVQNPL